MRYLTKEWCSLCKNDFFPLEKSKEAENFSEEYFNRLYNQKLNEWLETQKQVSLVSFDDLYPLEICKKYLKGYNKKEIKQMQSDNLTQREKAKSEYYPPEPYDEEREKGLFNEIFLDNMNRVKNNLPVVLFNDIADIRVFSLGKASKKVINIISQYAKKVGCFLIKFLGNISNTIKKHQNHSIKKSLTILLFMIA